MALLAHNNNHFGRPDRIGGTEKIKVRSLPSLALLVCPSSFVLGLINLGTDADGGDVPRRGFVGTQTAICSR